MPTRNGTVYLHLLPGYWADDLRVDKMAKSENASTAPGAVVVELKLSVPVDFFETARPVAEVTFGTQHIAAYGAEPVEPEPEEEA